MAKWTHAVRMTFEVMVVDGIRVGGAGGALEIGGIDGNLTALKDPVSGQPYIPGSSLKGKLRSTLEKEHGLSNQGEPCGCGEVHCVVCPVFGAHKNTKAGASRLTVRDSHFTAQYAETWQQRITDGLSVFEIKTENIIDRASGTAKHPRTQERVPAGSVFAAEMILKVFERDDDQKMVANLKNALAILQQLDSIGSGGSRGSGRIAIKNFREEKISLATLTL